MRLTGAGGVGRVGVCAVEVVVADTDAGSRSGGAAVGGAGQAGPLSLLGLVASRGAGCKKGQRKVMLTSLPCRPPGAPAPPEEPGPSLPPVGSSSSGTRAPLG